MTVEDFVSSSQNSLFQGYTFFMTHRTKEESYSSMFKCGMQMKIFLHACVECAGSPEEKSMSFDKQKMLNQIVNRKGRVLEVYKDERVRKEFCRYVQDFKATKIIPNLREPLQSYWSIVHFQFACWARRIGMLFMCSLLFRSLMEDAL